MYAASGGEGGLDELQEIRTRRGHRLQGAQLPRLPASVQERMGGRAHLPQMQALAIVAQRLRVPVWCSQAILTPAA